MLHPWLPIVHLPIWMCQPCYEPSLLQSWSLLFQDLPFTSCVGSLAPTPLLSFTPVLSTPPPSLLTPPFLPRPIPLLKDTTPLVRLFQKLTTSLWMYLVRAKVQHCHHIVLMTIRLNWKTAQHPLSGPFTPSPRLSNWPFNNSWMKILPIISFVHHSRLLAHQSCSSKRRTVWSVWQ